MMDSYERAHEYLSSLGLTIMNNTINSYLKSSHEKTVVKILNHLLSEELKHKKSMKIENLLKWSEFPFHRTIDDFYFSFQSSIDRSVIDELMTMSYIHNNEDGVFLGSPAAGKTHLSIALRMRSIMSDNKHIIYPQ